jgi:hypothetical protein
MGGQLVSYLLPSVPVSHSSWAVPVTPTENSTTQNARNNTPTEGTGSGDTTVNNAPTEKRESAKLADGATERKTEENVSHTTASKYAL